ncbi:PKD-like family lipoprotein [Pedobacter endophyticus]|uniref:PKD-like family protein n=1 Tax=Pedobacter endophyticus TaxID=2789740 RepID=A0A7S9Q0C0_9SPHI|nr:PKD-like family lipoprotein [Pedobacter endophyticus]QPH41478.1 hypothetical protein IZT61_09565 [Pedobacter endophyticus]
MKSLIKIKAAVFLLFVIAGILQACKKDPGNYDYKTLNEAVVEGLDTLYIVDQGEILSIEPKISYLKDQIGDTSNYTYSWLMIRRNGFESGIPELKSSTPKFNVRMTDDLGLYEYALRVTDRKTEVWKEFYFKILISNKTYEGWFVLSEVNGNQSRLDMLSYKENTGKYEHLTNVFDTYKSDFTLKGAPSFVSFFTGTTGVPILNGIKEALVVGTSEMATFLGPDQLEQRPEYDFSIFSENGQNVAIGQNARMEGLKNKVYLWANGRAYSQSTSGVFEIGRMGSAAAPSFESSPFIAYTPQGNAVLFNETASEFVWYPGGYSKYSLRMENERLFKNKIDKNLLFMKYVNYNGGEIFAILKDKTGDKVYLARFTLGEQNYFAEIKNTPIAQAEHFEVSDDFGYVIYNVGNKVYEYDFNLNLNKEVADYGQRKISLLKFQYINTGYLGVINQRYVALNKQLVVCSYDDSNLNSSGVMDLYTVPGINANLIKTDSFTGFGKIVSLTYRWR